MLDGDKLLTLVVDEVRGVVGGRLGERSVDLAEDSTAVANSKKIKMSVAWCRPL